MGSSYGIGQGLRSGVEMISNIATPLMLQKKQYEHELDLMAAQEGWAAGMGGEDDDANPESASIVPSMKVAEQPAPARQEQLGRQGQVARMIPGTAPESGPRLSTPAVALTPSGPFPGEAEIANVGASPVGESKGAMLARLASRSPRRLGSYEVNRFMNMGRIPRR